MLRLGNCECIGCDEEAVGCSDDGDFLCEDHLFMVLMESEDGNVWEDEPLEDDDEASEFSDPEVAMLDTALFDGR